MFLLEHGIGFPLRGGVGSEVSKLIKRIDKIESIDEKRDTLERIIDQLEDVKRSL